MKAKTFSLYWCDTAEHDRDAFVVAASYASAQECFAKSEDLDPLSVTVEEVARLPESEARLREWRCEGKWYRGAGYPTCHLIRLCGGTICGAEARFGDRVFVTAAEES